MAQIRFLIQGDQPHDAELLIVCVRSLSQLIFDETTSLEVELAFAEAVTNSMRHGMINTNEININIILTHGCGIEIGMSYLGKPFDKAILETCEQRLEFDPRDIQSLPESGLGLPIIKKLMNEVSYRFIDGMNCWTFRKYQVYHKIGCQTATPSKIV